MKIVSALMIVGLLASYGCMKTEEKAAAPAATEQAAPATTEPAAAAPATEQPAAPAEQAPAEQH